MKETFYFSHDYNASMDEKIISLLSKHGMAGYGIFWRIIENLYNNENSLKTDYGRIAYDLHIEDSEIVRSIVCDFGLFCIKDGYFGSASIARRLEERYEKSEKARQSAVKRWHKNETDANAINNNAIATKNDAIKERKEFKGKNKIPLPPTKDEVIKYFAENGFTEQMAIKAFNHYDLACWYDTKGNPVLNWKQKMSTNWFDEKDKIPVKVENKPIMP